MASVSPNQDRSSTGTDAATAPAGSASAPSSDGPTIIGESAPMLAVMKSAARVADSNITVLIQGERGTGRELLARFLHERSPRRDGPFVAINCGAFPDHLLESELFGHEQGGFTGAAGGRAGRFERASGGTLFLEEVGEMSPALQAKILRAHHEREVERVGGQNAIPVDVRIIAATHRTLEDEVAAGRFREDLYYRLAVVVLTLPPLRERGDDIRLLAEHCIARAVREHRRPVFAISQEALAVLKSHPWPGNVRQFCNVMERALQLAEGPLLFPVHLPPEVRMTSAQSISSRGGERPELGVGRAGEALLPLAEVERRHIRRALLMTGGHLARAAGFLGIHRNTLRRKLQEYGIQNDPAAGTADDNERNDAAAAPPSGRSRALATDDPPIADPARERLCG